MNKIILVQPNYNVKSDAVIWTANPPLGLCYLAAVLEKEKIPVEVIDANVQNLSVLETVKLIIKKRPGLVGFSILTPAADWCLEVIKLLPKSITTIAGGPHPSGIPQETLSSGFDIVVIGEGEETLKEIALGLKWPDIKGIMYHQGKKNVLNPSRPPLPPDKIPFPSRHLILHGGTNKPYLSAGTRYFPWSPIITSRGCPYNCYFCNKNIFGRKFRTRSPENILEEIDLLVNKYHVREIDFYDDSFNFDIAHAERILDLLISRNYKLYLRFSNGIRADKVTKKLLIKMKKAGCDYIAYGIESGDPYVLAQIPKNETLLQIKKAVIMTHELGIPVTGFFIIGLIGDTKKTMQRTIDFANSLPFDRIILNIATPYPGTRMWQIIKERGGKIFINKWQDFYQTSGKMLYSLPGTANRKEVEEMFRRAHLSFYFRPRYIIKQIPKIIHPGTLPVMLHGLRRILYSVLSK